MKKRTIIACGAAIFTLIVCFSMVACTLGKSKKVSSEEKLKQFISEDFGASLMAMLAIDKDTMDDFYLLDPIYFNTVETINNPNIILPIADASGNIRYLYYVSDVNGYASTMSSAITPLLNTLKDHGSETVFLYQDDHDIYASINGKWFMQQSDGSVEELSDKKAQEIQKIFGKIKLVSSSFQKHDEYTAAAKKSYENLQSKK